MTEGVESVGEAVTGGMFARAVEPASGEPHGDGSACLNCGSALSGAYCHRCGQKAHIHRTLSAFAHDVGHSVLHFDGKLWRTLPLLAWRPGELTRRYVQGERASFVSPMALFLFSVFLMFALFSALGVDAIGLNEPTAKETAAELRKADRKIARLEGERRIAIQQRKNVERIDGNIREARMERNAIAAGQRILGGDGALNMGTVDTGWKRLDEGIAKANKNPALLFYKLQANAYKFSWLLIPLSLPFLWMLFLHRRRYRQYKAYDHVVFVTYSIAFMSIGLIALLVLRQIGLGNGLFGLAIALVPPMHMYRQLRGAYQLSRWSAFWRTLFLLFAASVSTTLFLLLLLALGVLG